MLAKKKVYFVSFHVKLSAREPQRSNVVKKAGGTALSPPGEGEEVHAGLQKGGFSSKNRIVFSKILSSKHLFFIFQQDRTFPTPHIPHSSEVATFLSLTNWRNRNLTQFLGQIRDQAFPKFAGLTNETGEPYVQWKEKLVYCSLNHSINIYCSWCCARHWRCSSEHYKNTIMIFTV